MGSSGSDRERKRRNLMKKPQVQNLTQFLWSTKTSLQTAFRSPVIPARTAPPGRCCTAASLGLGACGCPVGWPGHWRCCQRCATLRSSYPPSAVHPRTTHARRTSGPYDSQTQQMLTASDDTGLSNKFVECHTI